MQRKGQELALILHFYQLTSGLLPTFARSRRFVGFATNLADAADPADLVNLSLAAAKKIGTIMAVLRFPMGKRALLSVSDKTGIVEFAKGLTKAGYAIVSTGGTKKALEDAKIAVTSVEDVTGFPECFGGRVKTMHPMIMGAVLFRRDNNDDAAQAKKLGIEPIDLVCVNLYPFEEAYASQGGSFVSQRGHTWPQTNGDTNSLRAGMPALVELIDIGGPTLLRSAAKNAAHVTVVTDPSDYDRVLREISQRGDTSPQLRAELAAKVFARTAQYDATIAESLSGGTCKVLALTNKMEMRYGENPHQWGAYYDVNGAPRSWSVVQEGEKKMSYLNLLDADGAWNLVKEFSAPTAACIKHANPSGVASHDDIAEAFQKSYDTDKLSAFGVIIALNRSCPAELIQKIIDQKIFTEVIIAPGYGKEALELLKKKPKLRVIQSRITNHESPIYRTVLGGMLVQNADDKIVTAKDLTFATDKKPTTKQIEDLLFAWHVVKHAKSNAIVFAKDLVTVGIGTGQTSRVDSVWIGAKRAGDRAKDAVMASDAFFPFPDAVEEAAKHGVSAIIQPGGSVKDAEVFAKANELGIPMVLTGVRAFRH